MFAKNYLKSSIYRSISILAGALSLVAAPAMAQEEPSHQLESAISFVGSPPMPEGDAAAVIPAVPLEEGDAAMVGGPMHMLKGLALTDDQYEKMYDLRNDFMDKFGPKMVEVASLERHMRDTLTSSSIDTKKAGEIKAKLAQAKSDIAEMKSDLQIQMAQVLTSDQRKTLRLAMEKHCMGGCGRARFMQHHMGPGGHGWHKGHGHGEHGPEHGGEGGSDAK